MFKNFRKKNWIIVGLIILVILNFLAFYLLKESIGISDALEHVENEIARKSLQQKQIFSDVFPSIVFTLDIVGILFLLFILIKRLLKSLKKSTPTQ